MTLEQLFDAAEELELGHARLYALFSLAYGEWDERIATFWEQMSTEEWQHYIVLRFCRGLCASVTDLQQEAPAIESEIIEAVQALLASGEERVQRGELPLQESFELAIRLERSESDTIYDKLIDVTRQAVRLLERPYLMERIRRAQRQAEQHADRLVQAIRRFADSPALVRQAQQQLQQ